MRLRVDDGDRAAEVFGALPFVTGVERRGALEGYGVGLERLDDARAIELTRALVDAGVGVIELTRERESLESASWRSPVARPPTRPSSDRGDVAHDHRSPQGASAAVGW